MKYLAIMLAAAGIAALLFSGHTPATARGEAHLERNKNIALAFFRHVSDETDPNNVASAMSLFADDAVYYGVGSYGLGGAKTKAETTRVNIETLKLIKGRMKFKIHSITAEADRVLVEAENTCELINGEIYDNFYVFVFHIKDGKIQRVNEYLDTLYLAKAYDRLKDQAVAQPRAAKIEAATGERPRDPYFTKPLFSF